MVQIVVATYNGAAFLEEQLASIQSQTYQDFRVEICDDGSTDETREIAGAFCKNDNRFTLHENRQNVGYVKNFLMGIRRSRAEYIMLCDQDDIWQKDKIAVTLEAMQQEEKTAQEAPVLVFTDATNYDSKTGENKGSFHKNSHLDTKKVDSAHLFMENKCIGCTIMVNRNIQPFLCELPEEIRVHDWWLALICSHFGKIAYVEKETLLYRQHGANMIGGTSFVAYIKKRLSAISDQRAALLATYRQGAAFVRVFADRMPPSQREVAECFARLQTAGWLERRYLILRYGFQKSGWARNAGLFFLA